MDSVRLNPVTRGAMAAIAAIAWFALALQFYLEVMRSLGGGGSMGWIVANYFSFFTILTNLAVALFLTISVLTPESRWGRFCLNAVPQTGIAVYIAVVGATYSLMLRHLWNPHGAQKLANVLLHDAVPVLYVAYWLIFVPKAGLRWKHAFWWLYYPVVYMVYTLLRGVVTGWYPYPFIDVAALGFPRALGNGGLVLLAFFVLGLIAVAIGRWMRHRSAAE